MIDTINSSSAEPPAGDAHPQPPALELAPTPWTIHPDRIAWLAIDIETQPNEDVAVPEPEVKLGNLKDEEKIERKLIEAREAQYANAALDPNYGRIISVHAAATLKGCGDHEIVVGSYVREDYKWIAAGDPTTADLRDDAERKLLNKLGDLLIGPDKVFTFNGAGFDVPFWHRRGLLLGTRVPRLSINPYECARMTSTHVDLMLVLHGWEVGAGRSNPLSVSRRLADYARLILNEEHPEEIQNKLAYKEWFARGDVEPLRRAGEWDVMQTLRLALRTYQYYP